MDWDSHVIFEINDLYELEPEVLEELEHIDRRSAVKNIITARIKQHFSDIDDGTILDSIENPEVFRYPAVFLNLHLVFFANASESGSYLDKADYYAARFEESLQRAIELLEFDGLTKTGITFVR